MEISKKQKTKIMNTMRHQLSVQHMDSLEYPNGAIVGNKLEKNTQAVYDVLDNLPDYAVHNIIGKMRGEFRKLRRFAMSELDDPEGEFKDVSEALYFLYNNMMAVTKELLPYFCSCCQQDISMEECACAHQQCEECRGDQDDWRRERIASASISE